MDSAAQDPFAMTEVCERSGKVGLGFTIDGFGMVDVSVVMGGVTDVQDAFLVFSIAVAGKTKR